METREARVLVLAPTARDALLTESVLHRAAVACHCCATLDEVCRELDGGAGVLLIAEEALTLPSADRLAHWLGAQPPWSDLPVLVLARHGAASSKLSEAVELLGNVTVLERPLRVAALVSAIRSALRARARQYQSREADRRKDEFLAILAHELRNPLAPISNSLHALRLAAQRDSTAERLTSMLERQVNYMVRLVDDLMEVSRITRGKIELRRSLVDVATIVHDAIEISRPAIDAGGHRLTVRMADAGLIVLADPLRLAQVLANLLNNAAKYTDPGGDIVLDVAREPQRVSVAVRDNGAGIPADMLPRVFDLFTQVDRSRHAKQGGLGIGLTLVKALVEMHGGSVHASSAGLGQGSEFVVRLPLHAVGEAQPQVKAAPAEDAGRALGAYRVLVVDDNRDAALSLSMLLELLGADVEIAYDGPSALRAIERRKPAFVLLDIGMPGMDGHEVARRMRARADFGDVRIVALTGWGQAEDRRLSRAAGFDSHLVKPADLGALRTLLGAPGQPPAAPARRLH